MDIQRPELAKRNKLKKQLTGFAGIAAIIAIVVLSLTYRPGPYQVDKNLVFTAQVKQGDMVQDINAVGSLEPADIRWVTARTSGKIERIFILPGAEVTTESIILEMSNPELVQQLQNAQLQLNTDEANYKVRKARLRSNLLQSQSVLKRLESDYKSAELNANIDKQLFERGLEAKQTSLRSNLLKEQLAAQLELEQQRYSIAQESVAAELDAEENLLAQSKTRLNLLQQQVNALQVKAGFSGILQKQVLKEGQQVAIGQSIAQVVNPQSLKAEVKVSEHLAKQIKIGMSAIIDTRNGLVDGLVKRIDPNVENGSVQVDIDLTSDLPLGIRPSSSIEAQIQVQKLTNVLHVKRPTFAKSNSNNIMFKFKQGSDVAEQIKVQLGRASTDNIEIIQGLSAGDRIILSDVSDWINHPSIQVN